MKYFKTDLLSKVCLQSHSSFFEVVGVWVRQAWRKGRQARPKGLTSGRVNLTCICYSRMLVWRLIFDFNKNLGVVWLARLVLVNFLVLWMI